MKYLQTDGWTQGFGVLVTNEQWAANFKPPLKGKVKVYFKNGKKIVEHNGKIVEVNGEPV